MGVLALKSVNHVSFPVRDLEQSVRFYRDVLGLEAIPRPDLPFPGAWLGGNAVQVHLIVPPEGAPVGSPPPSLNPLGGHVAFAIDDYDAMVAALHAAGIETLEAGSAIGQLWIRDPDGHLIELIQPRAGRRTRSEAPELTSGAEGHRSTAAQWPRARGRNGNEAPELTSGAEAHRSSGRAATTRTGAKST